MPWHRPFVPFGAETPLVWPSWKIWALDIMGIVLYNKIFSYQKRTLALDDWRQLRYAGAIPAWLKQPRPIFAPTREAALA